MLRLVANGLKIPGQHYLYQLKVFRVCNLAVADAGWLVHAGASLKSVFAISLVFKDCPALEHINDL